MEQIKIPIHSFIDVITNSSTEIYISNSSKTKKMIKQLINNVLNIAGSDKTVDDLFEIEEVDENTDNDIRCQNDSLLLIPKDTSKKTMDIIDIVRDTFCIEEYDN